MTGTTTRYLQLSPTHVLKISVQDGYKFRQMLIELCNGIKEPLATWSISEQSNRIKTDFHMFTSTSGFAPYMHVIEESISEMKSVIFYGQKAISSEILISNVRWYLQTLSDIVSNTSEKTKELHDYGA